MSDHSIVPLVTPVGAESSGTLMEIDSSAVQITHTALHPIESCESMSIDSENMNSTLTVSRTDVRRDAQELHTTIASQAVANGVSNIAAPISVSHSEPATYVQLYNHAMHDPNGVLN